MSLVETLFGTTAEPSPPVEQVNLDIDDACFLLSNERRREIVTLVAGGGESWTVGKLASEIARLEGGYPTTEAVSSKERKRVHVALIQHHLDKLEEADVITRDRHDIQAGSNTSALAALLAVIDTRVEP